MPQPNASSVIRKLLGWITRVDAASRTNAARPSFADEDSGDIFPEGEPWWLTDVSRRAEDEKAQVADEDGPPSEDEEQPAEAEVSDEDPLSDADEPLRHRPIIGWHRFWKNLRPCARLLGSVSAALWHNGKDN